jgi:hypothetical protein
MAGEVPTCLAVDAGAKAGDLRELMGARLSTLARTAGLLAGAQAHQLALDGATADNGLFGGSLLQSHPGTDADRDGYASVADIGAAVRARAGSEGTLARTRGVVRIGSVRGRMRVPLIMGFGQDFPLLLVAPGPDGAALGTAPSSRP